MNSNVSVAKIKEGIDYLESNFTNPVIQVGEQLIDEYTSLNQYLNSDIIQQLIKEQQGKLDSLKSELQAILNKARSAMEDSSQVIQQNQANIDSTLES